MRCIAVIPARYGSSRLPGKPLADILGKPMIQHVHERVSLVPGLDEVIVATDDARIADVVRGFHGQVVMTDPRHPSGTDRLVEVRQGSPADIYLNVQGDEPLVSPEHLTRLLQAIGADPTVEMASLCCPVSSEEADSPHTVKVVRDHHGDALYFSRAKIPHVRDPNGTHPYLKHIGVYAFRDSALARFSTLGHSSLEKAESLEQLRFMQAGTRIRMVTVDHAAPGVDSPACLERVRRMMAGLPEPTADSLAQVRLVVTDVDGVLTDGGIWYDQTGECLKRFHVRDGLGIRMLQESGVTVAVISGRDSATLRKRLADLGITRFALGVKDKGACCRALMQEHACDRTQTAFIGDDSIDLPAFAECNWSVATQDAPAYVKAAAAIVLDTPGGHGAFRELADRVLSARGRQNLFQSAAGYATVMHNITQ